MTRSQTQAADVAASLRARSPIIVIETQEESRVERYLLESAAAAKYTPRTWDCGQGVADMTGKVVPGMGSDNIDDMLAFIDTQAKTGSERSLWIMRDLLPHITGPVGTKPLRALCNFARSRPTMPAQSAQAIVLLVSSGTMPPELKGHATVIQWSLPDRDEIAACLRESIKVLPEAERENAAINGNFDSAVDAAVGLPEAEAASAFGRSLVMTRKIDPAIIAEEKKRVISREKVLELMEPLPGGFSAIGGLESLKAFLILRKLSYQAAARAYGLPRPKGVFLTGVPGNAKTMTAKALGTVFNCPVVKFDLGSLKGGLVGQSEGNIRRAIQTIEAMGKCIVLIDEIEKGLQGATSGSSDGGTSADQLGTLLTWMNDRQGEAFIVATSNNAEALPPELLRKGRFDEVFFIDNPACEERATILAATLATNKRPVDAVDCQKVAEATADFSGAELAALIPEAMFSAFADGQRQIETRDVLAVANTVVPLAKQSAEKIAKLRTWANGRARPASGVNTEARPQLRAVDF